MGASRMRFACIAAASAALLSACAGTAGPVKTGEVLQFPNRQANLISASAECRKSGGLLNIRSTDPLSGTVLTNCDAINREGADITSVKFEGAPALARQTAGF